MPDRRAPWLALTLWFECVILLSALVAVFLPHSMMSAIHAELGLGPLPRDTIVQYLARSLSLVYAAAGPLAGFLARDVYRYREVIAFQAYVGIVSGLGLLALDLAIGMPTYWTLCEGPSATALALIVLIQVRRLPPAPPTSDRPDHDIGPH